MDEFITKNIVLEQNDLQIIAGTARKRGLGGRGNSAAIRQIIREWFAGLSSEERIRITELGREALKSEE